jgi:hypothetical protein
VWPAFNNVATINGRYTSFISVSLTGGPGPLGPGSLTFGTFDSGDSVGFAVAAPSAAQLTLPENYVWGSALASQATFSGRTFATLGLDEGTYTWTAGLDTIEVKVGGGSSSVPEGGSALAGLALVLAELVSARRSIRR